MKTARAIAEFAVRVARRRNSSISESDASQAIAWVERNIDRRLGRPHLPEPGQSVGVSLLVPKTAALCFDRVWWIPTHQDQPPSDILAYAASEFEIWMQIIVSGLLQGAFAEDELPEIIRETPLRLKPTQKKLPIERVIAETLFESRKIVAHPVLSSEETRDAQYTVGDTKALVAAINALNIVDEQHLTWAQVQEVRRDAEAMRKYRRMVHWLDANMVGRPITFIADEIASRIADYDWVLQKHGLQTAIGSLSCLLNPRFLTAAGAITTAAGLVAGTDWAAASAALMALAQSGMTVASKFIELEDVKRTTAPDIAYVFELRELSKR